MEEYKTIFIITDETISIWMLIVGGIFYLLVLVLFIKDKSRGLKIGFFKFLMVFVLTLAIGSLYLNYFQIEYLKKVYYEQKSKKIEGMVQNYIPASRVKKKAGEFTVNGIRFVFSLPATNPVFHQMSLLSNNDKVKIYYIDDKNPDILRFDIMIK